jgi:von Willebrand factor type A domain
MILHLLFAAQLAQTWQGDFLLPSAKFHPIGLRLTVPVPGKPGEKFQALRLEYKVFTQGGQCNWQGVVRHRQGTVRHNSLSALMRVSGEGLLPQGDGLIVIEVPGGQIEAFAADGPLILANMQVNCGAPGSNEGFTDPQHYETPPIHPMDFQHVIPDFELKPAQTRFTAHAGEAAAIQISTTYLGSWYLPAEMHLADLPKGVIPNSLSASGGFGPRIARNAVPGVYTIRAVGKGGSIEHSVTFELEILPPRDPLFPPDGAEPPAPLATPAPAAAPPREVLDVGATFRAEVDLRPMNVVVVIQHGASLSGPKCEAMKQFATYFVQQFVEGRDNVGVVGFNDGVHILDPLREDFKTGRTTTAERIAALRCEGSGGIHTYALEVAYEQIKARNDPAALNLIVMLVAAPPSKIATVWPVRTKADRRYLVKADDGTGYLTPDQEVDLPASTCSDTTGWRASFAPTMPHIWFWKPDSDMAQQLPIGNDCAMSKLSFPPANAFRQDIAYIPETDLLGVPFAGALELERFSSGPYSGRIRPDSFHNLASAALNNFVNAAQTARKDTTLKPVIHVIGIKGISSGLTGPMTPELLAQVVGDSGIAYLADQLEDFPTGFNLIFRDILHRAQAAK